MTHDELEAAFASVDWQSCMTLAERSRRTCIVRNAFDQLRKATHDAVNKALGMLDGKGIAQLSTVRTEDGYSVRLVRSDGIEFAIPIFK